MCEHGPVGFAGGVRRFSPPLSVIVSLIGFLLCRHDRDNYRYRYQRFWGGLSHRNVFSFDIEH